MSAPDHATFEIAAARPRLRDGLVLTLSDVGGEPGAIIEDELRGRFFRVGLAEYTFLSLLNGQTTIGEALGATALRLKERALTEEQAAGLCRWLIDSGLAVVGAESTSAWEQAQRVRRQREWAKWLNPLMLRTPLFSPDKLLRVGLPLVEWLISRTGAVLWAVLTVWALVRILPEWSELRRGLSPLLDSDNRWRLAATWLVLKTVHESAHGLVCQRFGGHVRECGINWLLFVPLPYVDVTSSWRFAAVSQRILVSAAGMLAEIALAAIAAIVWTMTDSPVVRQMALNVMVSATVTTLLFNANPLMRSDGYFILSDLLRCPNLSSHGRQFVRNIGRSLYLGLRPRPIEGSTARVVLIAVYGLCASVWSVLVGLGMVLGAANLWPGVGLLLAGALVVLWYAWPLAQGLKFLVLGSESEQPQRLRCMVTVVATVGLLAFVGRIVPAPSIVSAPVVVLSRPTTVIHSLSPGRVVKLAVQVGDEVTAGQVVLEMDNLDLRAELSELRLEVRSSAVREVQHLNRGEIAAAEIERGNRVALARREIELVRLIDGLVIRTPQAGRVVTRNLDELVGRELPTGAELMTIVAVDRAQGVALVPQSDASAMASSQGTPVRIWLWGHSGWSPGTIGLVESSATQVPPHPALTAEAGGPLMMMANDPQGTESSTEPASQWVLTEPRVEVTIELSPAAEVRLGETGVVHLPIGRGSLGGYLLHCARQWVTDRWDSPHGV